MGVCVLSHTGKKYGNVKDVLKQNLQTKSVIPKNEREVRRGRREGRKEERREWKKEERVDREEYTKEWSPTRSGDLLSCTL